MATILEEIQAKYPIVTDDARNIAEALAMASGTGGRGAGAIADNLNAYVLITIDANGGSGEQSFTFPAKALIVFPECTITPPEGKVFDYYCASSGGVVSDNQKIYPNTTSKVMVSSDKTYYAIWKDAE